MQIDFASSALPCHKASTSISLRFHIGVTLMSFRIHSDFTSISLHFDFAFSSLQRRLDVVVVSYRFLGDITKYISSRSFLHHFYFTSIPLGRYFKVASMHFDFTWAPFRFHFGPFSVSLSSHDDGTSTLLLFRFESISLSLGSTCCHLLFS